MHRIGINPNHCCTLLNRSPCNDDFQDIITFHICWVIFFVQINTCCKFCIKIFLNRILALNRIWHNVIIEAPNSAVTFAR